MFHEYIEISVAAKRVHRAVDKRASGAAIVGPNATGAQVIRVAVVLVQFDPTDGRI